MSRIFSALAAFLLLSATASGDDKPVIIRWHGQSFFEIVSPGGARIAVDPHAIEAYGRKSLTVDAVCISHFHNDHSSLDPIANASKAKQIFGLKKTERGAEFIKVDEKVKDVRIRVLPTYHDAMTGLKHGKNGAFIFDVAGLRIVHLGDLGHLLTDSQLETLGTVDVLMVPTGGVYTLNGIDAQKVVEQVKPRRYVIPMHYGTTVYTDLLDLKYFLEDQTMGSVKRFSTNELTIDPKAEAPKEPVIAILQWEGPEKKEREDKEK